MRLPQARVVREGEQVMTPPPMPRTPSAAGAGARELLAILVGTWPVTALMLLMAALLVMTAHGRH
jgi:hypothetical protein